MLPPTEAISCEGVTPMDEDVNGVVFNAWPPSRASLLAPGTFGSRSSEDCMAIDGDTLRGRCGFGGFFLKRTSFI